MKFKKESRLHHRSLVENLFRLGNSFYDFPFRVTWRMLTHEELSKNFRNDIPPGIGKLQFITTVPKKKRKRAVDRVLMRRRIREAYRINRNPLEKLAETIPQLGSISLAMVYIHNDNLPYDTIQDKMIAVISKLQNKITAHLNSPS